MARQRYYKSCPDCRTRMVRTARRLRSVSLLTDVGFTKGNTNVLVAVWLSDILNLEIFSIAVGFNAGYKGLINRGKSP